MFRTEIISYEGRMDEQTDQRRSFSGTCDQAKNERALPIQFSIKMFQLFIVLAADFLQ